MHSSFGGMCCGAGIDLWQDRALAGALGSVVITGRTRPRENGRRTKEAEMHSKSKCNVYFRDTDR